MNPSANRPSVAPPPKRSAATGVVVGVVIAVIVLVGLGVVLLAGGDDDGEETSSTVPATAPTESPGSTDGATQPTIELPQEYVGEIRPVTVTGTPLPSLDDGEAIGTTVPTVSGESFDGTPVEIAPGDGHTMVVVLAHWCPHCNNEIPRLIELDEAGRLPADLRIVGVSTAANAGRPNFPPSEWIVDTAWPWEILVDGIDAEGAFVATNAYGVSGFPFVTVFDANGAVTARWTGESDVDDLADKIDQAVGA